MLIKESPSLENKLLAVCAHTHMRVVTFKRHIHLQHRNTSLNKEQKVSQLSLYVCQNNRSCTFLKCNKNKGDYRQETRPPQMRDSFLGVILLQKLFDGGQIKCAAGVWERDREERERAVFPLEHVLCGSLGSSTLCSSSSNIWHQYCLAGPRCTVLC